MSLRVQREPSTFTCVVKASIKVSAYLASLTMIGTGALFIARPEKGIELGNRLIRHLASWGSTHIKQTAVMGLTFAKANPTALFALGSAILATLVFMKVLATHHHIRRLQDEVTHLHAGLQAARAPAPVFPHLVKIDEETISFRQRNQQLEHERNQILEAKLQLELKNRELEDRLQKTENTFIVSSAIRDQQERVERLTTEREKFLMKTPIQHPILNQISSIQLRPLAIDPIRVFLNQNNLHCSTLEEISAASAFIQERINCAEVRKNETPPPLPPRGDEPAMTPNTFEENRLKTIDEELAIYRDTLAFLESKVSDLARGNLHNSIVAAMQRRFASMSGQLLATPVPPTPPHPTPLRATRK